MAIGSVSPRSRRALLGAALGAGIATVASAIGRPLPARAADGDAVLVGGSYTSNSITQITSIVSEAPTIRGINTTDGVGVWGSATSGGTGVQADSYSGVGVWATSYSGIGVVASSNAASNAAGRGWASGGSTGIQGISGPALVSPAAKTGVHGYANQDADAIGVKGETILGHGVEGVSDSGIGVVGKSPSSLGVYGWSNSSTGVRGESATGLGVYGSSESLNGVHGQSTSGTGVSALSHASNYAAMFGRSDGHSTGVLGLSGSGAPPSAPPKTGVYGYAAQDASARGVTGQTTAGRGVYGAATTGSGVRGYATTGTAVYAASADPKAGYALRAIGRVKFDKSAGVATIASGAKTVVVTPGIDLTTSSAVVATLQGNPGGTTTVQRVAISTSANAFTIHLTANSTTNVKVAWDVFG